MQKEATARIKINKLLEQAGWRLIADGKPPIEQQTQGRTSSSTDVVAEIYVASCPWHGYCAPSE